MFESRNQLQISALLLYNFRALHNEVTAKNANTRATATATPTSQRAASRVHARKAAFSQPNARTAKTAAMSSWKSWRSARQKRRNPPCGCGAVAALAAVDITTS